MAIVCRIVQSCGTGSIDTGWCPVIVACRAIAPSHSVRIVMYSKGRGEPIGPPRRWCDPCEGLCQKLNPAPALNPPWPSVSMVPPAVKTPPPSLMVVETPIANAVLPR